MLVLDSESGLEMNIPCKICLYDIQWFYANKIISHFSNVGKPVEGRVTNNVGEIQAAIYAVKTAKLLSMRKLCIYTDSQFLINSVTLWIKGWKAKNWRLKSGEPVKNVVDFKELDSLLIDRDVEVKWVIIMLS